jgi:hypothetical protein
MRKPANAKGDIIHSIEVPEKFAKHREHYIRGYMQGYTRIADALAARRRALQAPKKSREGEKVSHTEADYRQYGTPERRCALCSMYQGIDKCSAVVAPISPQAVCKLFEKRESRVQQRLRRGI